MAKKEFTLDEQSAQGIQEVELARPVKNAVGTITGYDRAYIPKGAWDAQQELADEDKDPRYAELKQVSEVEKQLIENQKQEPYKINKAVEQSNPEVDALRKELAELKAMFTANQSPKKPAKAE